MEEWRDVPNWEGVYMVSDLGRVKSFAKYSDGRILKPQIGGTGYYHVSLGRKNIIKIHQLVAMAFLGFKRTGTNEIVVDHIDNNKLNNTLENLQLLTNRQNITKEPKGSSNYAGVRFNPYRNNYQTRININGVDIYLTSDKCEWYCSMVYKTACDMVNSHGHLPKNVFRDLVIKNTNSLTISQM